MAVDPHASGGQTAAMAKKTQSQIEPATSVVAQFEQSIDELERLVQRMEQGELSLDDSLQAYERGVALYRQCQNALQQAELRVKLLGDPGNPDAAAPFVADSD